MEDDVPRLIQAVSSFEIDVTFVGPEEPLAAGIVDQFNEIGLKIIEKKDQKIIGFCKGISGQISIFQSAVTSSILTRFQ